jgi:HPt (histidine-containing phosphotransfer) domain-containing protein
MGTKFTYADLGYLESMAMGSNEMIVEMIDLFIEQLPEFTEGMTSLNAKSDFVALGALAHKAKSSVAVMGMNDLANELKQLELAAKSGDNPDSYGPIIEQFINEVNVTARELGDYAATIR